MEETSLDVPALFILNGAYVKDWTKDSQTRKQLCEILHGMDYDRSATARVIFAVYDGKEVEYRTGEKEWRIANTPRGSLGFGWDDIFDVQTPGGWKTFGEMASCEKDIYSMRASALVALIQDPLRVES